jgi:pimeloyl-ACP methyl ester carboxylesterase
MGATGSSGQFGLFAIASGTYRRGGALGGWPESPVGISRPLPLPAPKHREWGDPSMVGAQIHRTQSDDGTEVAGHARRSGRALVLLHGGLGDGNPDMNMMLPFLVDHFRCFLMNTRGRGPSAEKLRLATAPSTRCTARPAAIE